MKTSKITEEKLYRCEHSPIRTQLFWIEMFNIPTFVSVHLVRHNIGVTHFVESNRDDRGGQEEVDRMTAVNHAMLCNAETLINMARKRLCYKAHSLTREVMYKIKEAISNIDSELSSFMVPNCLYRGGICSELQPCGRRKHETSYK